MRLSHGFKLLAIDIDTKMKAKTGDVIECLSCRKPVGNVLKDIPDDSKVLGDYLRLSAATYGVEGYLCDSCKGGAAFHDSQNEGWTIQIRGKRVS